MDSVILRYVLVVLLSLSPLAAASAQADEPVGDPHVRLLPPCDKALLDDAVEHSETVRGLLDRLAPSDLVVYVRCTAFRTSELAGRLRFMGSVAGVRYTIADVRLQTQWWNQVATLAHELMHAVEIAEAPWVQSAADMEAFYREAGTMTSDRPPSFETAAAREVSHRVYREMFGSLPAKAAETRHDGGAVEHD